MFDAHLHLQDQRFDTCRDASIAAALAAGIDSACSCGCAPDDWPGLQTLAQRPAPTSGFHLLPAFGVHPWYAGTLPADWQATLERYLAQHPESPVGEIGFDGLRMDPPRARQRQILCAQLEVAARLNRPVVLHGARAWGELLTALQPAAPRLPGFVLHAFSGSADSLQQGLRLGAYVSFSGSVGNPAAKRIRAAAAAVPANRLLIETDAPDMLPFRQNAACGWQNAEHAAPPEINHPANLLHVARAVAELRGVSPEEIAAITTTNARQVYRLQQNLAVRKI